MKKDGKKELMALLDIETAYDRVNRIILCDSLIKIGHRQYNNLRDKDWMGENYMR